MDKEVAKLCSQIREQPWSIVPELEKRLPNFQGKVYKNPELDYGITTKEGAAAVKECIEYLNNRLPTYPLEWNEGLKKAAEFHTKDTGPKGLLGHNGADGTKM
jgi:uncharacterized protein YkwD